MVCRRDMMEQALCTLLRSASHPTHSCFMRAEPSSSRIQTWTSFAWCLIVLPESALIDLKSFWHRVIYIYMDQTNSTDTTPSVPAGERIPNDAPAPSSMNDLEALDIVKVCSSIAQKFACYFFLCSESGFERYRNSRFRPQSCKHVNGILKPLHLRGTQGSQRISHARITGRAWRGRHSSSSSVPGGRVREAMPSCFSRLTLTAGT